MSTEPTTAAPGYNPLYGDQRFTQPEWMRRNTGAYAPQVHPEGGMVQEIDPNYRERSYSYRDIMESFNPIQHIPVLGHLYRQATGTQLHPVARVLGGAVTGPLGVASALANTALENATGRALAGHVLQAVVPHRDGERNTQLAGGRYIYDPEPVLPLDALRTVLGRPWDGQPWRPKAVDSPWKLSPKRAWHFTGSGATALEWRGDTWPVDDWNAYNSLRFSVENSGLSGPNHAPDWWVGATFAVSDLRLTASIECEDLANFQTEFELRARKQLFRYTLRGDGTASVQRTVAETGQAKEAATYSYKPRGDGTLALEFWHVDQQLWMFVNGSLIGQLPYEFDSLTDRLESSLLRTRESSPDKLAEASAPAGHHRGSQVVCPATGHALSRSSSLRVRRAASRSDLLPGQQL